MVKYTITDKTTETTKDTIYGKFNKLIRKQIKYINRHPTKTENKLFLIFLTLTTLLP